MKIAIINIQYYPFVEGGAEISTQKLAEQLAKDNQVCVICHGTFGYKTEVINGVTVYRTPVRVNYNNIILKACTRNYKLQCRREIKQILQEISPDIIHTNNLHEFSVIVWKIAYDLNIPIIHTLRDYSLLDNHLLWYEIYTNKIFSRYVSAVTAPSNFTLCKFIQKGMFSKAKIKSVVPNAIDFFLEEWDILAEKRKHNNNNTFNFAYCGRFSEEKGINWLIDIFHKINNKNAYLHLFGKGEITEESENILANCGNIINHGFCNEAILRKELERCDVIIVPSLWDEPFGRVVLDAYRMVCPVICTARGGLVEIVDDRKTGYLVKTETNSELIEAVNYFCDRQRIIDTFPYIRMKLQKFSIKKQAETFVSIYKQCLI